MAINVFPVNAVGGEPEYSGREARQVLSPLLAGASDDRPLGAWSGVRIGTPSNTVQASPSNWTVLAHSGILDKQTAAEAGPYFYAIDAAVTGAMNPAHATNPRIDIITVRLDDPAESDGSSVPAVVVVYKAGTAASSPVIPTPDTTREMILAQIGVPASGGGSPSVTWLAPYSAASGGWITVRNTTERTALASALDPSTLNPVRVFRADATAGAQHEYTTDGSTWRAIDVSDTGWVDLSGTASVAWGTNEIILRRIGRNVTMRVETAVGTATSGAGLVTLAPQFRNPYGIDDGASANASGGTAVQVTIDPGGVVRFYWGGSFSAANVIRWQAAWMVD